MAQKIVSLEWANWMNDEFVKLKGKVDKLFVDFHRESRENFERWLLLKKLLVPLIEDEVLAWQRENPHSTEADATKWVRSFATSDQELILYSHVWYDLVKEGRIETESHGRGHPRTYLVRKG